MGANSVHVVPTSIRRDALGRMCPRREGKARRKGWLHGGALALALLTWCALAPAAELDATPATSAALATTTPKTSQPETARVKPAAASATPLATASPLPMAQPTLDRTSFDPDLASTLDPVLLEAAADLELQGARVLPTGWGPIDETALLALGEQHWAFQAQLQASEDHLILRLSAVAPGSGVLVSHRLRVTRDSLEVNAVRALSTIVYPERSSRPRRIAPPATPHPEKKRQLTGRAILAAQGVTMGGYFGFALDWMSGSEGSNLVFPLMTLGAGAGLGAALVAAEEWEVNETEARYLWAAGTWPTVGTLLLTGSSHTTGDANHSLALGAGGAGILLGSIALSTGGLKEGADALSHSGATLGALLGGIGELMVHGTTDEIPQAGLGLGMLTGVLVAGSSAPWMPRIGVYRVMFANLSAGLGALAGAAALSPFLVSRTQTPAVARTWLGGTALGAVGGAVLGFALTEDEKEPAKPRLQFTVNRERSPLTGEVYPAARLVGHF